MFQIGSESQTKTLFYTTFVIVWLFLPNLGSKSGKAVVLKKYDEISNLIP